MLAIHHKYLRKSENGLIQAQISGVAREWRTSYRENSAKNDKTERQTVL